MGRFNIGAKYISDYNTGSDLDRRRCRMPTPWSMHASASAPSNKRWMVEFWALNLTDEEYAQVGFDAPLQNVSPAPGDPFNSYNAFLGAPRTYGMTFRFSY